MNKLTRTIILAVLAVLAAGVPGKAFAEPRQGKFEASAFGGYSWFDAETGYKDHFTWGGRFGYLFTDNLEAEAAMAFVSTKLDRHGRDADLVQAQADLLYNFTGLGKLLPYVAAGIGLAHLDPEPGTNDSKTAFLMDYGVGARYFITDNLAARLDFRQPVIFDNAESNYLATIGISYFFGPAKHPVKMEEEPPAPGVEIPPPLADSDGDGVVDPEDECPNTPPHVKVDSVGCPDSDGDGVSDNLDKCPDTPANVRVDSRGCPVDSDGDGVADYLDQCPDTPVGVRVDDLGCPVDSDGDGVVDYLDKCPGTGFGVEVDEWGCPKEIKRIELKIFFDTNSAEVKPGYFPELQQVADFLKEHPKVHGTIEGHTDNRGSAAYNLKLSERRARSVVRVAEERFGVAPGRLSAVGYGDTRPVADNSTPEGRALNRRIEAVFTNR